jgi:hypothetical protein
MKLTDRERLVLLLLPPALVLGGYSWWFNLFERPKLNQVEKEHRDVAAKQVSPAEVLQHQAVAARLQREVEELTDQKRRLQAEAAEIAGNVGEPAKRITAAHELTELFRRHGLHVVEEGLAKQGTDLKLPKSVTDAIGRLGTVSRERLGQVRCWRLAGRFADLRAAMQELAQQSAPPGIPVGLTMAEADVTVPQRHWTLFVWM